MKTEHTPKPFAEHRAVLERMGDIICRGGSPFFAASEAEALRAFLDSHDRLLAACTAALDHLPKGHGGYETSLRAQLRDAIAVAAKGGAK